MPAPTSSRPSASAMQRRNSPLQGRMGAFPAQGRMGGLHRWSERGRALIYVARVTSHRSRPKGRVCVPRTPYINVTKPPAASNCAQQSIELRSTINRPKAAILYICIVLKKIWYNFENFVIYICLIQKKVLPLQKISKNGLFFDLCSRKQHFSGEPHSVNR